jgi:hypothetical protein
VTQLVEALLYDLEGRGVRFPMVPLEFFIDNPMALEFLSDIILWPWDRLGLLSIRNISWRVKAAGA